jgi:hypothetical protein
MEEGVDGFIIFTILQTEEIHHYFHVNSGANGFTMEWGGQEFYIFYFNMDWWVGDLQTQQ